MTCGEASPLTLLLTRTGAGQGDRSLGSYVLDLELLGTAEIANVSHRKIKHGDRVH